MSQKGAVLILSCCKEKYEAERLKCWDSCIQKFADHLPIYYLFGKSELPSKIPNHPNVFKIIANCNDNYEDIALKMYDGYRYLSMLNYDFIIKLDENIQIHNISLFLEIIQEEVKDHDYIALKPPSLIFKTGVSKQAALTDISLSYFHLYNVSNKQISFLPTPFFKIPYAGGPAYVLSKKAHQLLSKATFLRSLYEDNAVAIELYINDISVFRSKICDQKIVDDPGLIVLPPDLDLQIIKSYDKAMELEKHLRNVTQNKPVCQIRLLGGLGNQLFIIAAGLAHCYKYDLVPQIILTTNPRPYYFDSILSHFKKYVVNDENTSIPLYNESSFSFSEIPSSAQRLNGYFQSSKYFNNIKGIIKNAISFSEPALIEKKLIDTYGPIFTDQTVIVHARRGDYEQKRGVHNPQPNSYYEEGLIQIKKKISEPLFLLLSDDPQYWVQSPVFQNEKTIRINESDINSLFLMMKCKHFIMANSTFSWWGAYLANTDTVIIPSQWFGPQGPQNWQDVYEDGWIKI